MTLNERVAAAVREIKEQVDRITAAMIVDGSVDLRKLHLFITSQFDEPKKVLSRIEGYRTEILRDIENQVAVNEIARKLSEEAALTELVVRGIRPYTNQKDPEKIYRAIEAAAAAPPPASSQHAIAESIMYGRGLGSLRELLNAYAVIKEFPRDKNVFGLRQVELLDVSYASAQIAVQLGELLFTEQGQRKIDLAEKVTQLEGERYSLYSDLYFVTLFRYALTGQVHRVLTDLKASHRVQFANLEAGTREYKLPGPVEEKLLALIASSRTRVDEVLNSGARSIPLVRTARAYLKHAEEYDPCEVYLLDPRHLQRHVQPEDHEEIFNSILDMVLYDFYENSVLRKVNLLLHEVKNAFQTTCDEFLTPDCAKIVRAFIPRERRKPSVNAGG